MPTTTEIKIKVAPHLAKFYMSPVPVSGNLNFYNNLYYYGLEIVHLNKAELSNHSFKGSGTVLKINVMRSLYNTKNEINFNDAIHDSMYKYIPTLLELIFANALVNWIVAIKSFSPSAQNKDIILLFLEKYGITEEDYRLKSGTKIWHTYQSNNENPYLK